MVLDSDEVCNIYGNDVGLVLAAYSENPNDPARGGGFAPTLQTPSDTTLERFPGITFLDTDRTTTLAALETLRTPVP